MAEKIEFYKETRFKQTEIGEVPEEWEVMKLERIIKESPRYGLTTSAKDVPIGPRFLTTTNVKNGKVDWISLSYCECTDEEFNKYCLREGDIIIARAGTVGVSVLVEEDKEVIYGSYMIRIKPQDKIIDPKYLFHFFQSSAYWKQIGKTAAGSTLKNINTRNLKNLLISFPLNKDEQREIISILSTIDEAIQKKDEMIAKTQELKKGVMQQLLTRGIGHTKFKQTEIGEIPEEWKVLKLVEVASVRYGLGQPPEADENGVPMIRATNIKHGKIVETNLLRVSRSAVPESRDAFLKAGDVIVVRSGAYTGDIGHITEKWEGAIAGYDLVISPSDRIDSIFLTNYLLSSRIQGYFSKLKSRSAQPHLNAQQVSDTPIALSLLPEQKKIASILSAIDEKIEIGRKRKEQLEKLKKGFMQNLLTGRVRAKVSKL